MGHHEEYNFKSKADAGASKTYMHRVEERHFMLTFKNKWSC